MQRSKSTERGDRSPPVGASGKSIYCSILAFENGTKIECILSVTEIPLLGGLFINSVFKLPKAESGEEQCFCPHDARFCFPSAMPNFSVVFFNAFLRLQVLGEIAIRDAFFLWFHINLLAAQRILRVARYALFNDFCKQYDGVVRLLIQQRGAQTEYSQLFWRAGVRSSSFMR